MREKKMAYDTAIIVLELILVVSSTLLFWSSMQTQDTVYELQTTEMTLVANRGDIEINYSIPEYHPGEVQYQQPGYGITEHDCILHWFMYFAALVVLGIIYLLGKKNRIELMKERNSIQ